MHDESKISKAGYNMFSLTSFKSYGTYRNCW